jgi:hypothetical protein
MSPADVLRALRAAHPHWQIWQSRNGREGSGVFYATPDHRDPSHGTVTLSENDAGRLDALICAQEEYWNGDAPSPPPQYGHLGWLTSR